MTGFHSHQATPTITQTYPPVPLLELVDLIRSFPSQSVERQEEIIRRLVDVHPIVNLDWSTGWRYRRARIWQQQAMPKNIREIIWRKDVPAQLGRANPAGFTVLYLADRVETALVEIDATANTLIAEFGILPDRRIRIAPIGELSQIQASGRGFLSGDAGSITSDMLNASDPNDAKALLITDSFLLECLTNREDNYILSSAVAKAIFEKNPIYTAVAFPSVRRRGAMNFVVRTEDFWNDWGIQNIRLAHCEPLAQGYYNIRTLYHVEGITNAGDLQWKDADGPNAVLMLSPLWTPGNL